MSKPPRSLVFEFAPTDPPDDRYASRSGPQSSTLRGSLGLVLPAAVLAVVSLPGHASAQSSTSIDDFVVGQASVSSFANGAESASTSPGQEASILGGERDIAVTRLAGASTANIEVFPDPGALAYSTGGGGTFGRATIVWDGDDGAGGSNNIDFDGLRSDTGGVDLTFGGLTDQIDIRTGSGDTLNLTVRLTLYADAQTQAVIERTQPNGFQTLSFRFSDFTVTGPGPFDITDVGAIRLDLITTAASTGLDVDIDFVQAASSVTATMVDQVLDSEGTPKSEPADPGDIIRYTVTLENPDDAGNLASTPLELTFDPALPPTSGLTALRPGSVTVPGGATVVEGNGDGDVRVVVRLDPIPDRGPGGACPSDNTTSGCVSITFEVVVGQVLPPDLLRQFPQGSFIPAQGTLTSIVQSGIGTTLRTSDPDLASPPRAEVQLLENLTEVTGSCGNGVLDPGEGCDNPGGGPDDFCTDDCRIRSIEMCPPGETCPVPGCTPGTANCPVCNTVLPGAIGDDSCESGFCRHDNVCQSCGDGKVDPGEGCDNPGRVPSEECTASCLITSCPTGVDCDPTCIITPGVSSDPTCHSCTSDEQCDSRDCRVIEDDMGICVAASCGDGILQPSEGCDDGNRTPGDGCNARCLIESCTTYPDCDRTCEHVPGTPSTTSPACSACNDAAPGRTGDDSCASGRCDRDDGTGVCIPFPVCGNGTLDSGEGCDDGNTMAGDGCNDTCRIESIEEIGNCRLGDCPTPVSCSPGSPECAACNTASPGETGDASCASGHCNADGFCQDCGDGNLDTHEGCDDTNDAGADGCSATCLIESCPAGKLCPPDPGCTSGSPDCNVCSSDPAGATGDASCESGYCDPETNTCGPRPSRRSDGGCSAALAEPGVGLAMMMIVFLCCLLRRPPSSAASRHHRSKR